MRWTGESVAGSSFLQTALAFTGLILILTLSSRPVHAARKVGMIIPLSSGVTQEYEDTFIRHLKKFVQVPQDVELITKITKDDQASRLQGIRELLEQKVDVLVPFGSSAALEAARESESTPIIFVGSYDPIQAGLIQNPERPEKNITGVTGHIALNILVQAVLEVTALDDLAVLYNSDNLDSVAELNELKKMSEKMAFTVRPVEMSGVAMGETPAIMKSSEFVLMTTGCCSDESLIIRLDDIL